MKTIAIKLFEAISFSYLYIGSLDQRIAAFEQEFVSRAREDEAARRLITIPGIRVMNATALIAAIGNGETFSRGRLRF